MKLMPGLMAFALLSGLSSTCIVAADDELPSGVAVMLQTSSTDSDSFTAVLDAAIKAWPQHRDEILDAARGMNLKATEAWVDATGVVATQTLAAVDTVPDEPAPTEEAAAEEKLGISDIWSLKGWTGEFNLGGSSSTGNSDQQAIYAGLKLNRSMEDKFEHAVSLRADIVRSDGSTKTEKGLGVYGFTWRNWDKYLISNVFQAEYDRFAGYDYRLVDSINIGRQFLESEKHKLRVEVGPGFRYTNFAAPEVIDPENPQPASQTEFIGRAALNYDLKINGSLSVSDRATFEYGASSTTLRNILEVNSKLNGSLSARASLETKYDSGAPEGKKNTDSVTRLSIVYGF